MPDFGPQDTQFGLGMAFLGLVWVNLGASQLGWVYLGLSTFSLAGQFMLEKRTFSTENHDFLGNFCDFLENSLIFLGFLGHAWTRPEKNWPEPKFGRRGKLTCHRIDELLKPNWVPRPTQSPRRPPPDPPGGFGKLVFFFKKKVLQGEDPATYSPSR